MLLAPMARVARHFVLPVERVGINSANHLQHLPRHNFFLLIIAGAVALHMASVARQTGALHEHSHGGANFFGFQNFQIFRRSAPAGAARSSGRRLILRKQRGGANRQSGKHKSTHGT